MSTTTTPIDFVTQLSSVMQKLEKRGIDITSMLSNIDNDPLFCREFCKAVSALTERSNSNVKVQPKYKQYRINRLIDLLLDVQGMDFSNETWRRKIHDRFGDSDGIYELLIILNPLQRQAIEICNDLTANKKSYAQLIRIIQEENASLSSICENAEKIMRHEMLRLVPFERQ